MGMMKKLTVDPLAAIDETSNSWAEQNLDHVASEPVDGGHDQSVLVDVDKVDAQGKEPKAIALEMWDIDSNKAS